MKRKWTILLAIPLLIVAIVAERGSKWYGRKLAADASAMQARVEDMQVRTHNADMERERYNAISAKADRLEATLDWKTDTTDVLRWFADVAADKNVRLLNSKLQPIHRIEEEMVLDTFHRTRYSLQISGPYGALTRYLEAIERSPLVIIVEDVKLTANRDRWRKDVC